MHGLCSFRTVLFSQSPCCIYGGGWCLLLSLSNLCMSCISLSWAQQYTRNRLQVLGELKAKGINPYPHKFQTTMRLPEFVKTYSKLDAAQRLEDKIVSVAGRSAIDTKSSRIWSVEATAKHLGNKLKIFVSFWQSNLCYVDQERFWLVKDCNLAVIHYEYWPVTGRILSKRSSGTSLHFYDLHGDGVKIQVFAELRWVAHDLGINQ